MIEDIKLMLGLEGSASDKMLALMIEDTKASIRDYCNRADCPSELDYLVRQIVINKFNADNRANVASIKRGDTQINYASAIDINSFSSKELSALVKYKKVTFI